MIDIRPNCVQNIKKNLSKQKFGVLNGNSATSSTEPVFKQVKEKTEIREVLKFFLNSFNESAGSAGISGKNRLEKLYGRLTQSLWASLERYQASLKDTVVEVVKEKNKTIGCYSLSFDSLKNNSYINFLAVSPEIKNSKMTVKTLFNMANRISEQTKSKNLDVISWTADARNKKAYRLFDKFPAIKQSNLLSTDVDFFVTVDDFDKTLNKYM